MHTHRYRWLGVKPALVAVCLIFIQVLYSQTAIAQNNLVIGGSGADLGTFQLLAEAFSKSRPDVHIEIRPSMGSSGGVRGLKAGAVDLAITSRPLKDKEKTPQLTVIHYATTPFVFAVQKKLPHTDIKGQEVVEIYTGKRSRWPDGSRLRVIYRPERDSDTMLLTKAFQELTPVLSQVYSKRGIVVAATDQENADLLSQTPGAIGTSALSVILAENRPLKALKLDGITPSRASLVDGRYPMSKSLYMVYLNSANQTTLDFIDYVQSGAGARILEQTGHWVHSNNR